MKYSLSFLLFLLIAHTLSGQVAKSYKPSIEFCDCRFRIDSSYLATAPLSIKADSLFIFRTDSNYQTQCGYLVVPENRKKTKARNIKLPFIILKSKNPNKKQDPLLFTSGGPGNSSLGWVNGMARSSVIKTRDCIAFEQRGTRYSIPYLRSFELDTAIRESYRKNLNKDSMTIEGVKRYRKKLLAKGIDPAGYNTDETIADIHDLLNLLRIDSVNLIGGSYSGGLMLGVLQKDPSRIRSLVLDSPLPTFVPIDEDEPANFTSALRILSQHCEKDSADKESYSNLEEKFRNYFTSIIGKKFYFPYVIKGTRDTLRIEYTKNELLEVIVNNFLNRATIKDVPYIITQMIQGNHSVYIKSKLDAVFDRNPAPDGMRMLVYCADQAAYNRQSVMQQYYDVHPYMKGYHINDVYKEMCDCWNVPPVKPTTKQPFYSKKPVLICDGEMDPACTPFYMSMIKHYMPNSQCFLFINFSHGVGGKYFQEMAQQFLDNPFQKIESPNENVKAY
jgi:pimeloyl-ACP methyl ester carboxylesterase